MSETIILSGRIRLDDSGFLAGLRSAEQAARTSARTQEGVFGDLAGKAKEHFRTVAQEAKALGSITPFGDLNRSADAYFANLRQQSAESSRMVAASWQQTAKEHAAAEQAATQQIVAEWRYLGQQAEELARTQEQAAKRAAAEQTAAYRRAATDAKAAFSELGRDLTVGVTLPVAVAGAAALKASEDLEAQQDRVRDIFGQSAESVRAWSKTTTEAFGVSERQALSSAAEFGNLFSVMGFGRQQAAQMSERLVKLGADLGSLHHVGTQEVLEKISSGLVGMSRPLRSVGIIVDEAQIKNEAYRSGIAAVGAELTEQQKVQARYQVILRDGAIANDNFARTQDELQNQTKKLKAELDNEAATLGQQLLPVAKEAVKTAREMLTEWQKLPEPMKHLAVEAAFAGAVFGPLIMALERVVILGKGLAAIPTLIRGIGTVAAGGAGTAAAEAGGTAVVAGSGVTAASVALPAAAAVALQVPGAIEGFARTGNLAKDLQAIKARTDLSREEKLALAHQRAIEAEREARTKGISGGLRGVVDTVGGLGLRALVDNVVLPQHTLSAEDQRLIAAVRARDAQKTKEGTAPSAGANTPTAEATPVDPKKLAKEAAQTFEAQMDRAKAAAIGTPQEQQAQEEAKRLLPILMARQVELKKQAAEVKGDAEKSAELDKASAGLDLEMAELKSRAAREQAANAKRQAEQQKQAEERFRQIRGQVADAQIQAAKDSAAGAPEAERGRAALKAAAPLLLSKIQTLNAEASALVPQFDATGKAQEEYSRIALQSWQAQAELDRMRRAAAQETTEATQKASRTAAETLKARDEALIAESKTAGGSAAEIQALQGQAEALKAKLSTLKDDTKEYWDTRKEIASKLSEADHLQDQAAKQTADAQRKAAEDAKKRVADALDLSRAETSLIEAKLKTAETLFGKHDRQAARYVLPSLASQFRTLAAPVAGETAAESLRRRTDEEGLGQRILEEARKAGLNPRAAFAELSALDAQANGQKADPRLARFAGLSPRNFNRDLDRLNRIAPGTTAAAAPTGNNFNFPIVVPPLGGVTEQERRFIHNEVDRRLDELARMRR